MQMQNQSYWFYCFAQFISFYMANSHKNTYIDIFMTIGKKIDLFLELPSVPIFYDKNGKVINNLTAPYTIKSELKVKCEVVGGKLNSSIVKNTLLFLFVQYTNIP